MVLVREELSLTGRPEKVLCVYCQAGGNPVLSVPARTLAHL